jgi:uncharacterized protein (DUF302 family)
MSAQKTGYDRIGLAWFLLLVFVTAFSVGGGVAAEKPVKTVSVEGVFDEVRDAVKLAIENRGINIAHVLPASDMLNGTAKDFGIEKNIYQQAETVEFCSARISHLLAQANHENIVLCPFTISIYVLTDDPGRVHMTYRRPFALDSKESQAAVTEVIELIESILAEASEW